MDHVALVERARAGDVEAFTELVRRHQRLALGSALALLRDADLARDVVQESFVAAWRGLGKLADPRLFAAWLHGIVRRQAFHALRVRHLEPLTGAEELASDTVSADQRVEAARRRMLALAALAALPEGLREPAALRYVHDCSQAQIAAFLGLPVTTVNNRLHAARVRLKRRLLVMMKDALTDHSLPEDFPARIGHIVRAEGPVIEARFEPAGPPELFSTLVAADEAGRAVTVEVVQHLPDGRVRAVARSRRPRSARPSIVSSRALAPHRPRCSRPASGSSTC
jgi:RNA polymerase sigma-70 factor (ECF subfamily)